jgi:asparagine synthase (glutamine-hydrolysing)
MTEIIKTLKVKLTEVVERMPYKGLLFSGGLDTSILASLNPNIVGITVSLGPEADDLPYAISLAKLLGIKHYHKMVDIDEAIEGIPCVIKILRSFDPALPNDLVVYFALQHALDLGLDAVATGDGSDELFAGYSFMKDMADLEIYIQKISKYMTFSSNELGQFFSVKIIQPYLDRSILDYALKIPSGLKIKEYKGKLWGKWILRKAFEDVLPKRVIWQKKRPLEYGSGMRRLRQIVSSKVSDEEFERNPYPIRFISKEHFYYYKIFKEVVGDIPEPKEDQNPCPGCGAGINPEGFHCKICGYVLDWRLR